MVGKDKSTKLIKRRIIEITAPDSRNAASEETMKLLFSRYFSDKTQASEPVNSDHWAIKEIEKIKLDFSAIKPIYYEDSLLEVVKYLQPGDLIFKKNHESHLNPIPIAQRIFNIDGYREAHKCSHVAMYLGEINGDYWIGEATLKLKKDSPELRRIKIDDPIFSLKEKNQYIILRRNNEEEAKEAARLARNYTIKMLPQKEKKISGTEGSLFFNPFEAVRSLWHSSSFSSFAHKRIFDYYTDYKNGIAFEYFGKNRGFFCSHFALIMESMSELNKSENFQKFLQKHPCPMKYDDTKKGAALSLSKLWYSIRKGVWSRYMTIRYSDTIDKSLTTKIDALRTTPRKTLNYMIDHKDQYQVVGIITHKKDFEIE